MQHTETLLLTEKDIQKILSVDTCLSAVEASFHAHGEGKVVLPPKLYLILPDHIGDFRAMTAYLGSPRRCGLKWVNVHPQNKQRRLPTVMGIIILNDVGTGFPLAILDGTFITKMRTGAGGAVAAKYLARKDSNVLGLVGCGVQAQSQLLFLSKIFHLAKAKFWGPSAREQERFRQILRKRVPFPLEPQKTLRGAVSEVDILVTTTPSRRPLVQKEWIRSGTHINAIGADAKGKQELDPSLLKEGKIVVDDWHQASLSGEINVPYARGELRRSDIYATLGEVVCGLKRGRTHKKEITIFDATGLAVQDVAVAWQVYQKAVRLGIGKKIRFF